MAEALAQPLRSFLAHQRAFRLVPQLFLCLRCTAGYCVAMNELSKSLDEPRGVFEEHLLFNLVYCSQVSPGIEQADVDAIIATARRFNPILGITGILVFGGGVFFQWIEGPKAKVLDLVSRIEADVRHEEMAILSSDEEIRERIFPTWDMELVWHRHITSVTHSHCQCRGTQV